MRDLLFYYLCAITSAGFVLMGIDKRHAIRHTRRIPEKTLFCIAAIGGSLGVWIGMYLFRHKTRHLRFVLGIPAILLAQLALVLLVYHLRPAYFPA